MTACSDHPPARPHSARLEALGTMASGIAHEINSPIQFIGDNLAFIADGFATMDDLLKRYHTLYLAVLADEDPKTVLAELTEAQGSADLDYLRDELPSAIEQSLAGIQQVARIASAMKTFAHRGTAEKEMADLNQAIDMTAAICRNEWKYDADLELALDPALPRIACHVGELSQVWLNLIVNAAHAIKARDDLARGLITISTEARDGMIEVSIADNGTGMSPAVRERVFEPFFSTKEAGEGSGQGLAICRSIVTDQHGGEIALWTRPGEGSRFTVRLPLEPESDRAGQKEEVPA